MAARLTALMAAFGVVTVGCGGGAAHEARELQRRSFIETVRPRTSAVVGRAEIGATAPGSAERAFLIFWSDLQRGSWRRATAWFDRGLRNYIGDDLLARALNEEAAYFRTVKPRITRTIPDGPRRVVIYAGRPDDRPKVWWGVWRREPSGWRLRYWAFLDRALAAAVQRETQNRLDPFAVDPPISAIRAGERAMFLQYGYLGQVRARPSRTTAMSP